MTYKDFEDHLRKEVGDHKSAVDGDALWQMIQPQVQEKRKKRRPFWLWFLGFALIGGLLAGSYFWLTTPSEKGSEMHDEPVAEQSVISQENGRDDSNDRLVEQSFVPQTTTNEKVAKLPSEAVNNQVKKKETKATQSNNHSRTAKQVVSQNKNIAQVLQAENSIAEEVMKVETVNVEENKLVDQPVVEENERVLTSPDIASQTKTKSVASSALLPPPGLDLLTPKDLTREIEDGEYKLPLSSSRFPFSFGFGARVGLLRSIRQLEAKEEIATEYLRAREASESQLETFEFGLDAYLNHKKSGLYFRTGFNYTRTNERFEYEDIQIERDSVEGVREIRIGAGGDTTQVFGQVAVTRRTEYRRKTYNSIQWLDIPLIVGYQINSNSPLKMSLEGGVHLNAAIKRKGTILQNPFGEFIDFGNNDDLFKSSVGVGFYAGFALHYEWTPGWEVGLQPNFRFYPSAISTNEYNLEQSYRMIGVNASIRISLNP